MARVLSPNLIGTSAIAGGRRLLAPGLAARLLCVRRHSGWSERAQLVELEFDGDVDSGMRLIDEAIQAIIIRRAAPDWLPFVPGASYWVPPRKMRSHSGAAYAAGHGLVELVGRLANPMTEEEALSFTTSRGWPSSAYFVGSISPQQVKSPQETDVESDDERK